MKPRAAVLDVSTRDGSDLRPGSPTVGDDGEYEFKSVRAIRGTEARTIAKWRQAGWELETQRHGTLRTEMTFRRMKPKDPWQQLVAVIAKRWAAYRRAKPKTQLLLAASVGLVLLTVIVGILLANRGGGRTFEPTASPTEAAAVPNEQPSGAPSQEPAPVKNEPEAKPYTYQGPQYEIVVVDENIGPAKLNQVWVYTGKFDYSTDEYKDQVRMIVADIAHSHGTAKLIVQVVTDKEIAEAEAASTYESFVEEYGEEYAVSTIPAMEKS